VDPQKIPRRTVMAQMYTIHIHAIPLADNDGKRGTTITKEKFDAAVQKVSEYFAPADLRFAFDPDKDWHPRKDTSLNSLHNGGSGWWKEANGVAAQHRGKLVIFLRWGAEQDKPADNWFAYPPNTGQKVPARAALLTDNVDFVAITNQDTKFGGRAASYLAHEIGHYLGLFHTHPTWGDPASPTKPKESSEPEPEKVIEIVKSEGAAGLDGDLLSDTAPDPGPIYYEEKVSADVCGGPASFKIEGVNFKPDRRNFMSYFQGCQPPVVMSSQQIVVMRKTLDHQFRAHLIAASKGTRYLGIFRAGTDAHALWVGDDWDGFKTKCKEFEDKGLRLIDLETYVVGNTRRYAGVFRAGTDAHALWVGDDWDGFKTKCKEFEDKGLRLINMEVYGPSVS